MYKVLKCMCRAVILLVRSSVLLCSCCRCGRVFHTVPNANTLIPLMIPHLPCHLLPVSLHLFQRFHFPVLCHLLLLLTFQSYPSTLHQFLSSYRKCILTIAREPLSSWAASSTRFVIIPDQCHSTSEKLYSSPNPTLTVACYQLTVVVLGEG